VTPIDADQSANTTTKSLIKKLIEYNKPLVLAFIGFQNFDTIE